MFVDTSNEWQVSLRCTIKDLIRMPLVQLAPTRCSADCKRSDT